MGSLCSNTDKVAEIKKEAELPINASPKRQEDLSICSSISAESERYSNISTASVYNNLRYDIKSTVIVEKKANLHIIINNKLLKSKGICYHICDHPADDGSIFLLLRKPQNGKADEPLNSEMIYSIEEYKITQPKINDFCKAITKLLKYYFLLENVLAKGNNS